MYLGIDLGTSAVKVLLMNKNGEELKTVSKDYPIMYPKNNWAEQNPMDWWEATKFCIKKICSNLNGNIDGLSFSGQMHGLVILDEDEKVIRPAILWCDQRTEKQCEYLNSLDNIYEINKLTGNQAITGFTAPKILWIKENEPENFNRINKIMLPKDYIAYKLSGVFATDTSDASGMFMFNVKKRQWSSKMLELLGLNQDQLAKVYESSEVIGNVQDSVAEELGLNCNTKVIIGGGDQAVGAVGVGAVEEGIISVALGTSGVVYSATETYHVDKDFRLHSFCGANKKYHQMGVMLSAAASYKWWVENINESIDYNNYNLLASNTKAGSNGLYFLPYLMGERTPHNDANAKGTFIGLNMTHNKGHMTRSILEGVSYGLKDSLELLKDMGIKIEKIRVSGGGAKSKIWKQILADIFQTDIITIHSEEGPALGAAILASVGCGEYNTVEEACSNIIKESHITSPIVENKNIYNLGYQKFKSFYPALKNLF